MDFKEKVKALPSSPGVYLMKDSLNSIIYVGKSKNLKSRVGSYFQNSKSHTPKVMKMVKNIRDFEYILTDTEFEAFMLECKLIHEIKPEYNRKMKSPMSYTYIKIGTKEKYPKIEISSECSDIDNNLYFGPYTSRNTVERGIEGLKTWGKILCSSNFEKASPCLNYSLGSCIGMCFSASGKKKYTVIFHRIIQLLNGADEGIIEEMENKMNSYAQSFDFESAAKYRDYITAIKYLKSKVKVIDFTQGNKSIALLEQLSDNCIKFFLIRKNAVLFSEKYNLKNISSEDLKCILRKNIALYLMDNTSIASKFIKKEEIDEAEIIYSYLQNENNDCKYVIIPENQADIDEALIKLLCLAKLLK